MRKKILAALLLSVLTGIAACSGTQTCRVTGLTVGQTYKFGFEDSNGNAIVGEFKAESPTYDIPGVDSSVNCGSILIIRFDLPEEPPVA
jgi:ABC-type glycerol-3-phosphate transport system substrate-binding protein